MSDQPIITDAAQRYFQTVNAHLCGDTPAEMNRFDAIYRAGMIAVGLEIETRARIAERLGDALYESNLKEHIAASLRDLLSGVGIADQVHDEYERQVKMLNADPYGGVSHDASQPGNAVSSLADAVRRASLSSGASELPHGELPVEDMTWSPVVGTSSWPGEWIEGPPPASEPPGAPDAWGDKRRE